MHLDMYVEVTSCLAAFLLSLFHLFPVCLALMSGHEAMKGIDSVVGKRTGIHIRFIVQLIKYLLNLGKGSGRDIRSFVKHSIYSAYADTCFFCNVLYRYAQGAIGCPALYVLGRFTGLYLGGCCLLTCRGLDVFTFLRAGHRTLRTTAPWF